MKAMLRHSGMTTFEAGSAPLPLPETQCANFALASQALSQAGPQTSRRICVPPTQADSCVNRPPHVPGSFKRAAARNAVKPEPQWQPMSPFAVSTLSPGGTKTGVLRLSMLPPTGYPCGVESSSPSTLSSFRPREKATPAQQSVQPIASRDQVENAPTQSCCASRGGASSCLPSGSLDVGAPRPSSSCDSPPAAGHGRRLPHQLAVDAVFVSPVLSWA